MFLQIEVLAACKMFLKFSLILRFFSFIFQSLKWWPFDKCVFSIIVFLPDDIACLAYP